jgi:hypothetical protein
MELTPNAGEPALAKWIGSKAPGPIMDRLDAAFKTLHETLPPGMPGLISQFTNTQK